MVLGLYKTIEELEVTINLPELELLVTTVRDQTHAQQKFQAALKGINLDDPDGDYEEEDQEERLEIMKARAAAINAGQSADAAEFEYFGIDVETE